MCSLTARCLLHILHRIFRRPCDPNGVGGCDSVGVAGYFAILSMGGGWPRPSGVSMGGEAKWMNGIDPKFWFIRG